MSREISEESHGRARTYLVRARPLVGFALLALVSLECRGAADAHRASPPGATEAARSTKVASTPSETSPTSPPESAPIPSDSTATDGGSASVAPPPSAAARIELPRGGRELFPAHRLVGFCGTPGAPALGKLAGNLMTRAKTVNGYADKYARSRKPLPVFELIAVVVQGGPGNDGKYRRRVPESVVDDYLRAARAAKALLLLNIQPGHSDFMTEARHFERFLREPDVGLALDPEWAMKGKQKPGSTFGQTTGAVLNEVAEYLAGIVKAGELPEKALVFHQVNSHVVKDESVLTLHPGVVFIKAVDGLGPKGAKIKTYNFLVKTMPTSVHAGFKLFFDEDTASGGKLMTPEEVLRLSPEPEYVMYE